jgi:hypothetical protein
MNITIRSELLEAPQDSPQGKVVFHQYGDLISIQTSGQVVVKLSEIIAAANLFKICGKADLRINEEKEPQGRLNFKKDGIPMYTAPDLPPEI